MMENKVMTPEEFAESMTKLSKNDDVECAHIFMDGLMCSVLRSLGYGVGVDIFKSTNKHYA